MVYAVAYIRGGGVMGQNPLRGRPYLSVKSRVKQTTKMKIHFGVVGRRCVNSPVKLDQFSTNNNFNR